MLEWLSKFFKSKKLDINIEDNDMEMIDAKCKQLNGSLRGVINIKAKEYNLELIYSIVADILSIGYTSGYKDGYAKKVDESL